METKWVINPEQEDVILTEDGEPVAMVDIDGPSCEIRDAARLIAAAPELLKVVYATYDEPCTETSNCLHCMAAKALNKRLGLEILG